MHSLTGPSQGTAAQFLELAQAKDSKRPGDVADYLDEVYRLANLAGIPAHIVVCQGIHETDWWRSHWWESRCNPAGLGITGDKLQNEASKDFGDGRTAARAHVVHLGLYIFGVEEFPDVLRPYQALDPRWDAAIKAGYAGKTKILADLTGRWAKDAREPHDPLTYDEKLERLLDALGFSKEETTTMKPYILITAGHCFTEDDGNPDERARTPKLAAAYTEAFRSAGYQADWWQRDLDGDSNPTMTIGSRATVAKGCANVIDKRPEPMSVLLDLHFDGAHSRAHAVIPDSTGLKPGVSGGSQADDTAGNNTLDVTLARRICDEIVKATGLETVTPWRLKVLGVMSERDSGVGGDGWRLGMFAYTYRVRKRCARMVIEHAGYEDAPTLKQGFEDRCAAAAVKAVTEVFAERERLAEKLQTEQPRHPEVPQPEPEIAPVS